MDKGDKHTVVCSSYCRHTAIVLDPGNNSGGGRHQVHFTDEVIEEHKANWLETEV